MVGPKPPWGCSCENYVSEVDLTGFLCRDVRRIDRRGERRHCKIVYYIKMLFYFMGV